MTKLLKKEFILTGSILSYLFILFSLMAFIPSYPILVGAFFVCLGILYTFQFAREYNDVLYTALLPINKCDTVKARYLFVICIQMVSLVLTAIVVAIRMTLLKDAVPYAENLLMNANMAYLGYFFVVLAMFNIIFLAGFFKTAFYYGKWFIIFCIVTFVVVSIGETLHHLPNLGSLNALSGDVSLQLIVLAFGAVLYIAGTAISLKLSIKRFENIDL